MTLTRLLEIDLKLLGDEEFMGMAFAQGLWEMDGSPVEPVALCCSIEHMLCSCRREGIRYPPILLRRKKEMERGVWLPAPPPSKTPHPQAAGPNGSYVRQRTDNAHPKGIK